MNKMATRDLWTRLGGFSLDFRLAVRMLAKYPLLTIVAGAGMAFGIAAGIGGFEIRRQFLDPILPLDEGHRIVGIRNWDVRRDRPAASGEADFRAWLEQVQSVEDLGAVALLERNLTVNGNTEPIGVAEMTASGFQIARVAPLLGRTLVAGDESPSAPPVAVIGHSLWQRRFLGDPRILGRTVRLGVEQTTIVGVMPERFGFPVNHELWIPFRRATIGGAQDARPLHVFGRLATGVTRDSAQTELTTIGRRMAADDPDTHELLLLQAVPYAHLFADPRNYQVGLNLANVFLIGLVLVVAANVALLMFARAASRESEIVVRSALGASRGRIVAQLFVEAVVLSGLSAIVGLAGARFAIGSLLRSREADSGAALPFWISDRLTPSMVAYGVGLTMLGAVIIGVIPALKVVQGLHARLRSSTAGGGAGYRFGGVWTAAIVAQVAITVAFPATAFFFHRWVVDAQARNIGVPVEEYLSARLVMDPITATGANSQPEIGRHAVVPREELQRRLTGEPGVRAVTFANALPGMQHPAGRFEVEGDAAPPTSGYEAAIASVDADFFGALRAPLLSGRSFTATDLTGGQEVAIVNLPFVAHVMHGGNPLGRRIRRVPSSREQSPGPWIEIVGVASDLGMTGPDGIGLYRPLAPDTSSLHIALHVGGAPEALSRRLRAVAIEVEPTLRVYDVKRLDDVGADRWLESQYVSRLLTVMSGLALLLSLMAIYSVTAFTVVQRTREIGVRVALGAGGLQIVVPTIRGPLFQIGLGIAVGAALVIVTFVGMFASAPSLGETMMIVTYVLLMLAVSLLACGVPTRRALRLEPSQVLRADA